MNADRKKRIAHEISNWKNACNCRAVQLTGDRMAALLQELVDAPEQATIVPDDEPVAAQARYMAVRVGLPSYGNSGFGPWQPSPMPKEGDLLKGVDSVGYAYEIRLLYAAPQAPAVQETWSAEQCAQALRALRYIQGIAERGEGRRMRDDETLEQFLLGYVQRLEAPAVQSDQSENTLEMVKRELFHAQLALLNEGQQRDKLLAALIDLVNQPQDITTPAYQAANTLLLELAP